ncbi:2-oxo acid dehydrogenase subunit E2 [Capillimicrobium parvum]|uniref:Dihydrolipoyllysine-residue acetyltransferase component of pyruvate dehydrogenase complex n=1 Tax=Capillimicrobium parvum TaxID=2884022 RepID=A0A9E6XWL6_9ACTN|nr:2-oxo acid dehydrogenase subunit E2 [Capillimicrobium parvum]UGS35076.1 Dihydrolipoyllysine-residue acetyltransferase component of pyruvate dehydrogenase complex [Capillimicrobium parvum]
MTVQQPPGRTPAGGTTVPFVGLRGAIARAMTGAWEAPRVAVAIDVRLDACEAARRRRQDELGESPRLSPTHYILRAVALALRDHPRLNGVVAESSVRLAESIDIGLAVSLDEGLLVPVVREVDAKPVETIARETADLAARARAGRLEPSAQRGATFTISTLGATGSAWFTPILNAPQVAILGVGAIERRPIVVEEGIVAATMTTLTLVFDHRATDGHPAATFLAAVRDQLEDPQRL